MPPRSANSRSDRARPAASSSNHARPRAIALISVGSHRERSFCVATPGSTSLISTPRRLKATGAVSSIVLSLGSSDVGGTTAPPINELRRTGQRVSQDPDHGVFDFLGWQPPALGSIRSRLRDQSTGDVVAIAPAFL